MLFRGHCCLLLGTDFCSALSPHRHDKLRILVVGCFQWLGASFTQGKVSSISIVFSWGGSISPDGFLPSILLLMVINVAVVIVVVTVILVVVVVVAIIVVVVVVDGVSSIIKLSFMIIGSLHIIVLCYLIH
ncbi:hypothetical protein Tco_1036710 [Tanacetum coccineum]